MVAVAFLVFRIFVRVGSFKTLYVDDVLVIVAWALMLANSIVWQNQKNALYAQYDLRLVKRLSPRMLYYGNRDFYDVN